MGASPIQVHSTRTGKRCTTLIQFPVAFWAGNNEKALPVPIKPDNGTVINDIISVKITVNRHGLPNTDFSSWVSLKLASTQTGWTGTMAIKELCGLT